MSDNQAIPSTQSTGSTDMNPTPSSPEAKNKTVSSDELPSTKSLQKSQEYTVLDKKGEAHTFKSLYDGLESTRVLIIFIRHFFCGSCQEFISALSQAITPSDLQNFTSPPSIIIIGCGDPGLIDFYATETKCPYPIYADPERKLYKEFGLVSNYGMGARPEYFSRSMPLLIAESMIQTLKHFGSGLMMKGGESSQNGGEFIFEGVPGSGEEKSLSWCHRMTNTRDHLGMEELKQVLDPEGQVWKSAVSYVG
ncbi:uncharacterized protein N7483_000192 [Penicillium malachiteum]|uniref:uncharacterized protein n=1 Tax=Penicillium malachiteum TaxID=1324776 RepID=UPI00254869A5|nr:uncharacterized protein N7483_000192 [Penicillium malachiteum]KAJ5735067.1 hypothetical protein N7483_000192 [Penicillium malachiteum]